MNKKISKLILFLTFIIVSMTAILLFFTSNVYADEEEKIKSMDEIIDEADDFISNGSSDAIDEGEMKSMSNTIYNLLLVIGMIVAVVVGSILGIQYMTSTVEGKAESKKKLVAYFVGCAILFSSFGIWSITVNILQNTEQGTIGSSSQTENGESQGEETNEGEIGSGESQNGQQSNNNESNGKYTIKLNKTQLTEYIGDKPKKITLTGQVLPKNSNTSKEKIEWTSSNQNIATVTQSGVITLKQKGTVKITAKLKSNPNITASCNISVKDIEISLTKGNTLMLSKHRYNYGFITVNVKPSSAKIRYSSSNTKIATVGTKNGKVKAKKYGTAKITVTATVDGAEKKVVCNLRVIVTMKEKTSDSSAFHFKDGKTYYIRGYDKKTNSVKGNQSWSNAEVASYINNAEDLFKRYPNRFSESKPGNYYYYPTNNVAYEKVARNKKGQIAPTEYLLLFTTKNQWLYLLKRNSSRKMGSK